MNRTTTESTAESLLVAHEKELAELRHQLAAAKQQIDYEGKLRALKDDIQLLRTEREDSRKNRATWLQLLALVAAIGAFFGVEKWKDIQAQLDEATFLARDVSLGLALSDGPGARPEVAVDYLERALARTAGHSWPVRESLLESLFIAYANMDRFQDGLNYWEVYKSRNGTPDFTQLWTNNSLGVLYLGQSLKDPQHLRPALDCFKASEQKLAQRTNLSLDEQDLRFYTMQHLWIATLLNKGCDDLDACDARSYLQQALKSIPPSYDFCDKGWLRLLQSRRPDVHALAMKQLSNEHPHLCSPASP